MKIISSLFISYLILTMFIVFINLIYCKFYELIKKVSDYLVKDKKYYLYALVGLFLLFFVKLIYDFIFLDFNKYCEKQNIYNYGNFEVIKTILVNYYTFLKDKIFSNIIFLSVFLFIIFIIPTLLGVLISKKNIVKFIITFLYIHIIAIISPLSPLNGFITSQDRVKVSSVKANMHTLQTMLETYAVDWNARYPKDIQELKDEALKKHYWKDLNNPYKDGELSNFSSVVDINNLKSFELNCKVFKSYSTNAGNILYNPIYQNKIIYKYYLYGIGQQKDSVFIIKDKNEYFTLTNQ